MKVVLDTNVFISGIFWKGDPNKVLRLWKEHKIQLVNSIEIILSISFMRFKEWRAIRYQRYPLFIKFIN
jgi:putative PIN family toxin of toxin-antitoxin system